MYIGMILLTIAGLFYRNRDKDTTSFIDGQRQVFERAVAARSERKAKAQRTIPVAQTAPAREPEAANGAQEELSL